MQVCTHKPPTMSVLTAVQEIFGPNGSTDKAQRIAQKLLEQIEGNTPALDNPQSNSNIVITTIDNTIMHVVTSDVITISKEIRRLLYAIMKDTEDLFGDWRRYGSIDLIEKRCKKYHDSDANECSDSDDDYSNDSVLDHAERVCERIEELETGYFRWPISYALQNKVPSKKERDFMVEVMDKNIPFFKQFIEVAPGFYYNWELGYYKEHTTIEVRPFQVLFSYNSDTQQSACEGSGYFELESGETWKAYLFSKERIENSQWKWEVTADGFVPSRLVVLEAEGVPSKKAKIT